ncbi:MAG: DNA-binding protein [Bacteroidota bacterium]
MTLTFNELRRIKDRLPDGSMKKIAKELDMSVETVRNYFGGTHYSQGRPTGFHLEPGPDGGVVRISDTKILEMAQAMLGETPATASASS